MRILPTDANEYTSRRPRYMSRRSRSRREPSRIAQGKRSAALGK
jgi:hypothetical protein